MKRLHNEDLELQIKLAQLQADVQINLTVGFGISAILGALVIGILQTIYNLPSEKVLLKTILLISGSISSVMFLYASIHFTKKVIAARKKMDDLKIEEINEEKISLIADDQLRVQFGTAGNYSAEEALENQLASAAFYLMNMGYSRQEIQEKFNEVRQNPQKLAELFTLPQKEIYNMPSEIQQANESFNNSQNNPPVQNTSTEQEHSFDARWNPDEEQACYQTWLLW